MASPGRAASRTVGARLGAGRACACVGAALPLGTASPGWSTLHATSGSSGDGAQPLR